LFATGTVKRTALFTMLFSLSYRFALTVQSTVKDLASVSLRKVVTCDPDSDTVGFYYGTALKCASVSRDVA
jgi:hypothetical protein